MLWFKFTGIYFEEVHRLLWVLASNIVESTGGDVVRLALPNQRVVLKQILNLRSVRWCLPMQDPLCLGPKNIVSVSMLRNMHVPIAVVAKIWL
jgi:hypothetical protein